MPRVASFAEAMLVSVTAALMTLLSFLPALIGALILLIVGWFLADIVARLVLTVLRRVGFERAAERTGVTRFIAMTGSRETSAAFLFAELVKWFIRLVFVEMAAEALHLTAVTTLINQVLFFIPNLVVALVVVMFGVLIANFVAGVVRGGSAQVGMHNPNLLATVSRVAIIALAVIVALNQVGIATTLVNTLFIALVGAIALALGLSFGLGGRDVAAVMWQTWYHTGRQATATLEQHAAATQMAAAQAAQQAQVQQAQQAPAPAGYEQAPVAQPQPGLTSPPQAPYQGRHGGRQISG